MQKRTSVARLAVFDLRRAARSASAVHDQLPARSESKRACWSLAEEFGAVRRQLNARLWARDRALRSRYGLGLLRALRRLATEATATFDGLLEGGRAQAVNGAGACGDGLPLERLLLALRKGQRMLQGLAVCAAPGDVSASICAQRMRTRVERAPGADVFERLMILAACVQDESEDARGETRSVDCLDTYGLALSNRGLKRGRALGYFEVGRMCMNCSEITGSTSRSSESCDERLLCTGVELLRNAVRFGHVDAHVEIARAYELGLGVVANKDTATLWFKAVAAKNVPAGLYGLGKLCQARAVGNDAEVNAFYLLEKAGRMKYLDAYRQVGLAYEYGRGVRRNLEEAFEWYCVAYAGECPRGSFALGLCLKNGVGVWADEKIAHDVFMKAAQLGCGDACFELGAFHERGTVVSKSPLTALAWYTAAVSMGSPDACHEMGNRYRSGNLVDQSMERSFRFFEEAANGGCLEAYIDLGLAYDRGHGVSRDIAKAVHWYSTAARKLCHIGDFTRALELWEQSRELGDVDGLIDSGNLYAVGRGVARDDDEAVRRYAEAAERGSARGIFCLAHMHRCGFGVPLDLTTGSSLYIKAAHMGCADAQCNAANAFRYGEGVTRDNAIAARLYQSAAEQGYPLAQEGLAYALAHGDAATGRSARQAGLFCEAVEAGLWGCSSSHERACDFDKCMPASGKFVDWSPVVDYYSRKSSNGDAPAMRSLGLMYKHGIGVSRDGAHARILLKSAVEKSDAEALVALGEAMEHGTGGGVDLGTAAKYYRRASNQGSQYGKIRFAFMLEIGLGVDQNRDGAFDLTLTYRHEHA